MGRRRVVCKECGWEGDSDVIEENHRCPKCGSHHLKTTASKLSNEENLHPPEGAMKGQD